MGRGIDIEHARSKRAAMMPASDPADFAMLGRPYVGRCPNAGRTSDGRASLRLEDSRQARVARRARRRPRAHAQLAVESRDADDDLLLARLRWRGTAAVRTRLGGELEHAAALGRLHRPVERVFLGAERTLHALHDDEHELGEVDRRRDVTDRRGRTRRIADHRAGRRRTRADRLGLRLGADGWSWIKRILLQLDRTMHAPLDESTFARAWALISAALTKSKYASAPMTDASLSAAMRELHDASTNPLFRALVESVRRPAAPPPTASGFRAYSAAAKYSVGDKIRHATFGEGTVTQSVAGKVHVQFAAGVRVLAQAR